MSCCELSYNIWGTKLNDDLALSWFWTGLLAKGRETAISSLLVIDVRNKESWKGFCRKEESNMDAILEGAAESG
jgi:hypothetical protein